MKLTYLPKPVYRFLKNPRGKKISTITAFVFTALIIAGLALPFFYSKEYLKAQLAESARKSTFMKLREAGDIKLHIFPRPSIEASDVIFDNPDSYNKKQPLMIAKKMTIQLNRSSLLGSDKICEKLILDSPEFYFSINQQGKPNWRPGDGGNFHLKPTDDSKIGDAIDLLKALPYGIFPANTQIVNATVHFQDDVSKKRIDFENMKTSLSIAPDRRQMVLQGSAIIDGEAADWNFNARNIRAFSSQERTPIKASFASKNFNLNLDGFYERNNYTGNYYLTIASLKTMYPWLLNYEAIQETQTPLELTLEGRDTTCGRTSCRLGDTRYQIDTINGRLSGNASYDKEIPVIDIHLNIRNANIPALYEVKKPKPEKPDELKTKVKEMQEAAKAAEAAAKQAEKIEPWSKTPFNLHMPNAKIDLDLNIERIDFPPYMRMENAQARLKLEHNVLNIDFKKLWAFDGNINLNMIVDNSGEKPEAYAALNFNDIDAPSLIRAFNLKPVIDGRSNITTTLTAEGASPYEAVRSLAGTGMVFLKSGNIRGVDLSAAFRNTGQPFRDNVMRRATGFDVMYGNLAIKNGIIRSDDIYARSRALHFQSEGTLNLTSKTFSLLFTPVKVIRLDKAAGTNPTTYPVNISGSLEEATVTPDLKKPIKRDEQKIEKLENKNREKEQQVLMRTGERKKRN